MGRLGTHWREKIILKRLYLVIGPQSSGTRMMTRALILSGCTEMESIDGCEDLNTVVIHRSIPDAGKWPKLINIELVFRRMGYYVQPIIMTRDWNAICQSQVNRKYVNDIEQAQAEIQEAYRMATQTSDFIMVSYEAFCLNVEYRKWLFEDKLILPDSPIEIIYGNDQYYKENKDDGTLD